MFEVLRAILVNDLQCSEHDVLPTAGRSDVGLDSLAAVELSALLESRLRIRIADYELLGAATVADVARLMEQRQSHGVLHPAQLRAADQS